MSRGRDVQGRGMPRGEGCPGRRDVQGGGIPRGEGYPGGGMFRDSDTQGAGMSCPNIRGFFATDDVRHHNCSNGLCVTTDVPTSTHESPGLEGTARSPWILYILCGLTKWDNAHLPVAPCTVVPLPQDPWDLPSSPSKHPSSLPP